MLPIGEWKIITVLEYRSFNTLTGRTVLFYVSHPLATKLFLDHALPEKQITFSSVLIKK